MTDMPKSDSSHTVIDPPRSPVGIEGEIPEDPRIVEVVQEYLARLESGQVPDRIEYVRRYPDLAAAVEQCLEGLELMHAESQRQRAADDRGGPAPAAGELPPESLGDLRIMR